MTSSTNQGMAGEWLGESLKNRSEDGHRIGLAPQPTEAVSESRIDASRKAELGQFMTPPAVAVFMASMFSNKTLPTCRLLDAGAGTGALSSAFLNRYAASGFDFGNLEVSAFEIDELLRARCSQTLAPYGTNLGVRFEVLPGDFIEHAVREGLQGRRDYTHAILNPPYKKINSNSKHRADLRCAGIETVNLYSAFVALSLSLLAPEGELVAIIPRSFCNGPYYRPFREFVLARAAICEMHLFESRNKAFKADDVLQENVIIKLRRGARQGKVKISTSTDATFVDLKTHSHPFNRIVLPGDAEKFIHVPTSSGRAGIELLPGIQCSLADIGVSVSTGPVVDFRVREHIRNMPEGGTVPLLYPAHFNGQGVDWPKANSRKPNAIHRNSETERWLYPVGFYCVVRRFSSKEEERRIVARVVDPKGFACAGVLGFENHLNVFHSKKEGLPEDLARGLSAFLNTTVVDEYFRRFNGHTQVNATDLKLMRYPTREALMSLGVWAARQTNPTQAMLDEQLEKLTV